MIDSLLGHLDKCKNRISMIPCCMVIISWC
jgi:hypothetical protein